MTSLSNTSTDAVHGTGNRCVVGVDLVNERVTTIAIDESYIAPSSAYVLHGNFAVGDPQYSLILLDGDDTTYNGRKATEIALASQGVGLGWTFRVNDPRASRGEQYAVRDLQACEPDELDAVEGITVKVVEERDSMGLPRVDVYGPAPQAVIDYVRSQWGDEDPQWFNEYVVGRVEAA